MPPTSHTCVHGHSQAWTCAYEFGVRFENATKTATGGIASACLASALDDKHFTRRKAKAALVATSTAIGCGSAVALIHHAEFDPVVQRDDEGKRIKVFWKKVFRLAGIGLGVSLVVGGSYGAGFVASATSLLDKTTATSSSVNLSSKTKAKSNDPDELVC